MLHSGAMDALCVLGNDGKIVAHLNEKWVNGEVSFWENGCIGDGALNALE